MTWREGVEYWRAWARQDDDGGDIRADLARIADFHKALVGHELDDEMPDELVKQLGMQ